jgi:hypothetical protein
MPSMRTPPRASIINRPLSESPPISEPKTTPGALLSKSVLPWLLPVVVVALVVLAEVNRECRRWSIAWDGALWC